MAYLILFTLVALQAGVYTPNLQLEELLVSIKKVIYA